MASVMTGDAATEECTTVQYKPSGPGRKPHTLDMVLEAIAQNTGRKGVTVDAIKKHLATQDSSISNNIMKSRLRKALDKGFKLNLITRPKGSEQTGMSLKGRFLVNKNKVEATRNGVRTAEAKSTTSGDSKPAKQSRTGDNMPPKKVVKTVKKSTTNKENVAKTANKARTIVAKKTTTKPATKTTKTNGVVKAAKNTTIKTVRARTDKLAKVSKSASATPKKTTVTKQKPSKLMKATTKNMQLPGTPKISQPRKMKNM